jgi:hypothetical protein
MYRVIKIIIYLRFLKFVMLFFLSWAKHNLNDFSKGPSLFDPYVVPTKKNLPHLKNKQYIISYCLFKNKLVLFLLFMDGFIQ